MPGTASTHIYTAANLDTLAQAVELCRSKAAARVQLYNWLVFNILAGNADNHLKNISFLVDSAGINIAPAYALAVTTARALRAALYVRRGAEVRTHSRFYFRHGAAVRTQPSTASQNRHLSLT
jgi:hypothetical protein